MDNTISTSTISRDIHVGSMNRLAVTRMIEFGLVLRNHNGDQEVLLPNTYVKEPMKRLGGGIDVFVYTDSEDRMVATTLKPYAMVGEFAYLEVVEFQPYGAFVDWGLPKDLFVPLSKQKTFMQIGKSYILRLDLDEETNRVYASQKIGKYLQEPTNMVPSQKFNALVIAKTPMGYKLIADGKYEGMIYDNEIFTDIIVGEKIEVYLKNIRDDKKLDFSLEPIGSQARISNATQNIIAILKNSGGKIEINTKSSPEKIEQIFNISKKNFKATINSMKNDGIVQIVNDWTILL